MDINLILKKLLVIIILFVLLLVAGYILGAISEVSFDISQWKEETREGYTATVLIITLVSSFLILMFGE